MSEIRCSGPVQVVRYQFHQSQNEKNARNKTNTTHELFYNQHEFFITETDKPNIQQIYKTTFQDQLVDLVDLLDLV